MAHVLGVPAGQIGHPVAMLVLMKSDNGLLHDTLPGAAVVKWAGRPTPLKARAGHN